MRAQPGRGGGHSQAWHKSTLLPTSMRVKADNISETARMALGSTTRGKRRMLKRDLEKREGGKERSSKFLCVTTVESAARSKGPNIENCTSHNNPTLRLANAKSRIPLFPMEMGGLTTRGSVAEL